MYEGGFASWQGQEGEWFGELLAVPLDPRYPEPVTVVQFDQQYEALWAGTESGVVYTLQCPMLSRYASWQCHPSAVLDIQLLNDCAITVSSSRVALTTNGGYTRAAANLSDEGDAWMSAVVEPSTGSSRLLIAGSSGHIYTHDLIANKVNKQPLAAAGDGLALLRGPVGHRGVVAAGTAGGRVLLLDSRTNWQPASSTLAHVGGISALEVHGDMVATAGYSRRMGQVIAENMVKVFDCRSILRPLFTLPCAAPGMLAWHPTDSMSLMCTSASGLFMFADPSTGAAVETYQVDTAGDTLRSACISASGDAVAFGGSGGYVHLWAASHQPTITARSRTAQQLAHPSRKAANRNKPAVSEQGPYSAVQTPQSLLLAAATAAGATSAAAAAAAVAGTRLLSDVPETLSIDVGKPPRLIDQALKKELKQVDNIGYIPNPHYSRSKAPGAARKAAMHLQHRRLKLAEDRSGAEAARAARVQSRLAGGGTLLPQRYKRLVIKAQSSMRFEEFDFTYYNKTKFAGLENDLPNCYCNALLQVLYFTPAFREAILQHKPEASQEFCLTCELLFLFKMLLSAADGLPCQALNLLRALRQNREAAALGLLEGTIGAGPGGLGALSPTPGSSGGTGLGGVGIGALVMGGAGQGLGTGSGGSADGAGGSAAGGLGHEWGSHAAKLAVQSALPKRVVTLCRFLLDHLYKEAGGEAAAAASTDSSNPSTLCHSSSISEQSEPLAKQQQQQKAGSSKGKKGKKGRDAVLDAGCSSSTEAAAGQGDSAGGNGTQQNANLAGVIQDLFGLVYRSDMTALSGASKGTSKSRQLTTFQVDLSYPQVSSGKAAGGSSGGTAASPSPSAACSPVKAAGISGVRAGSPALGGSCPASPLPPLSPSPSSTCPATPGASIPSLSLGPGAGDKPGFGVLLANSLRAESVTKAWFDESCGYAYVRQARVPLVLPKTLVINCAMSHPSQAALWEPAKAAAAAAIVTPRKQQQQTDGSNSAAASDSTPTSKVSVLPSISPTNSSSSSSSGGTDTAAAGAANPPQQQHETPWLPWVLQVRSNPTTSQVDVFTADTIDQLAEQTQCAPDAPIQATYELTALICHITDEDEAEQQHGSAASSSVRGMMQSPTPTKSQGGGSSLPHQGHAVALIRVQQPYLDPDLVGGLQRFGSAVPPLVSVGSGAAAAAAAPGSGAAVMRRLSGSGGSLTRRLSSQGSGVGAAAAAGGGGSGRGSASGPKTAAAGVSASGFSLPDNLDDVFAELTMPAPQSSNVLGQDVEGTAAAAGDKEEDTDEAAAAVADGKDGTADNGAGKQQQQQQQQQSDGTAGAGLGQQWVVINDFSISPIPAFEVMNWYDAQKLPCLLFYTQVSALEEAADLPQPEAPSPVDANMFAALCAAPPLQGPNWRGIRTFTPLEFPREVPRPGFMVAIDAEFVAVARAETSFEGGVEVQLKPSRLALARVSVLRGAGPAAGTAFIDDYVACVEPVVDYLTRWSGIRPGDLDPSTSQKHLVSLKTAYLKLHHLLDAGCVFIGHGLKQDFRMLNLTVPPEQVRDTVELFSFRRQRKLSLRFLASYLLGLTIQTGAGAAGAAAAAAAATTTSAAAAAAKSGKAATASAATALVTTGGRLSDSSQAGVAVTTAAAATVLSKSGAAVTTAAAATVSPVLPGLVGGATGQGHDSIEDAATALALYNVYCTLQAEGKLEEKLHEMYRWGKQYGWEPVVHVNGVPQPPASAGLVGITPVI